MSILTIEFWVIVILTIICVNTTQTIKKKRIIILVGSCAFYLLYNWKAFLLLFFFSVASFIVATKIRKFRLRKRKVVLCVYISLSISLLGVFKYLHFFVSELSRVFGQRWNYINIIVPLGISFYVLSAIGYILDVYYGKYEAENDFIAHLVFLLYFPKLASGPIERGNKFFVKLKTMESISKQDLYEALQIILFGLIKKIVIADRMEVCVNTVFSHPDRYNALSLIFAMLGYSIQIFCDFSGYTDIAIGISKLMGISLTKNFDLPYCASNPSDFWRRWHISLSTWFRDYVYIPLGGNRTGNVYRNIVITMLLSGIWHGANWTFWIWGLCHGTAQCIQKFVMDKKLKLCNTFVGVLFNFIFVTCMWTVFRSDSITTALLIFKRVLTFKGGVYNTILSLFQYIFCL